MIILVQFILPQNLYNYLCQMKKIEDLIHSISSLINEAKQENELLEKLKIKLMTRIENKIFVNENLEINSDKTKSEDSNQLINLNIMIGKL